MANIDRVVNVQIALNTTGVSQLGFSTGMIVGSHCHGLSRVLTYTDTDELISDGFSTGDAIYIAASDYFGQTPKPSQVKVGRIQCNSVKVTVDEVLSAGVYVVSVKVKDTDGTVTTKKYSYTNSGGEASNIVSGIAALITADSNAFVTATSTSDVLTLVKKSKDFSVVLSDNLKSASGGTSETIAESMTAITAEDNDFYGIVLADRTDESILDMAEWTETHMKLFCTSSAAEGVKDASVTSDIASQLMAKDYYRTAIWYHALSATEYVDAADMARCFAISPGGETWANKKLASVTADSLSETEYNAVTKKNANTFEKFRNVSITQNGKTAAGEWIDVIRFRDWLQEEIRTNVFNLLINSDKVPYTDTGITAIESVLRKALEDGQTAGGIAPTEYDEDGNENLGYTITVPLSSSITSTQKSTRVLKDMEFTARLAGAIHVVNISGSFTYSNLTTSDETTAS